MTLGPEVTIERISVCNVIEKKKTMEYGIHCLLGFYTNDVTVANMQSY